MRVCYFGVYDPDYPRNAILRRGLEAAGVEVLECRAPVELGPSYMRGTGGHGAGPSRWRHELNEFRLMCARLSHLCRAYHRIQGQVDAVVLAEFNHGLASLAAGLAALSHAPLVVDFFLSLYETNVHDRGLLRATRPRAMLNWLADYTAVRLARCVLVETEPAAVHYDQMFGGVLKKACVMQIGVPEWEFQAWPLRERGERPLDVLYYGNYIPLHGVEYIIEAAQRLAEDGRFRFVLVGSGQEYEKVRRLCESKPGRVEFLPRQPQEKLLELIRKADVCLGIFGTSGKARRVVSNKVWQCMASGRPVITGDGPGARSVFQDGVHCLLVPHGDPDGIVRALDRLAREPQLARHISANAAALVREEYTSGPLGKRLARFLEGTVRQRG